MRSDGNDGGSEGEHDIVAVGLRVNANQVCNAYLARDLLAKLATKGGNRRLAAFDTSARSAPLLSAICVTDEKDAARSVKHGGENTDCRHARVRA